MKILIIDKELNKIETPQGTITLTSIFIPFFLEIMLLNMMGTVNTIMLGHYSDNAVAAVGAASQLMGMIFTFYTVISTGASIVISHNLGANNEKSASDAAFTSIIFSGLLSLTIGVILSIFAYPIMSLMQIKDSLLLEASTYFRISMIFSFVQATISSFSAIFRSYGKPKTAVTVSLFMNIINAILTFIVIFRPFETPLQGVRGIAISYVISQVCALILILILFAKTPLDLQFSKKSFKTLKTIKNILYIGIPGGISSLSYSMSQVVSTSIIAVLGVTAISAKIYLSNVFFYVYVIGLSLGLSTSLMIGWLAGAGKYEQAYRLNRQNLKITISINILISLLILVFGNKIISLFTNNTEIIAISRIIMIIDILVEIGRGFNHIEENSLRGAGDVFFQMIISIISCWSMSIFFSYILGIKLSLGLAGCWIAFAMDELFRGTIYFLRWNSRKWTQKSLLDNNKVS